LGIGNVKVQGKAKDIETQDVGTLILDNGEDKGSSGPEGMPTEESE